MLVQDEGEIQLSSSSECCCSRDPNIIAYSLDKDGLDSLFHAIDAGFDASVGRARCLAGTRVDILRHLKDWSSKPGSSNILWLSGDAGCGKSTVMQSFAEQLFVDDKLGASFFCSRDSWSRSDPERILPTLAYQLATSKNQATPMFRSALIDALVENPDSESLSQRNQLQKLIIGPLQESAMEAVIVVDGLDECRDLQGISNVLSLLFDASSSVPQVKFVFATRKDHDIASEMNREGIDKLQINIADDANIHDLSLFLRTEVLRVIRLDGSRVEAWEMLDKLLEAANGSFIFASTAMRFMSQGKGEQAYLLRLLQGGDPSQIKGRSVDMLYSAILDRAAPVAADVGRFREDLRSLLALLVVASHPLSLRAAKELLSCDQRFHLRDASPALSSVLQIPESDTSAITFWHRSFSDFLTGEPHTGSTASGLSFYVDQKHWHRDITQRCFEQMKERLSRNICGLRRYANNHGPNTAELLDQNISEATRYCCRHWIDHLVCNNEKDLEENPANLILLDDFLTKRQLLWFEALTLLGDLHRAAPLLAKVYIWLKNMVLPLSLNRDQLLTVSSLIGARQL